jgi:mono/diheme cytochrome c family protein
LLQIVTLFQISLDIGPAGSSESIGTGTLVQLDLVSEATVNRECQSAALTLIVLIAGAGSLAALALPAQAGDKPAPAAVYTEEQSARGEAVSTKSCAVCHGEQLKGDLAPPLQGDDFLKGWSDKTAGALFDKIITTMPANEPGTISEQQSADLAPK